MTKKLLFFCVLSASPVLAMNSSNSDNQSQLPHSPSNYSGSLRNSGLTDSSGTPNPSALHTAPGTEMLHQDEPEGAQVSPFNDIQNNLQNGQVQVPPQTPVITHNFFNSNQNQKPSFPFGSIILNPPINPQNNLGPNGNEPDSDDEPQTPSMRKKNAKEEEKK